MKPKSSLFLLAFLFDFVLKCWAAVINLTRYSDVIIILDFWVRVHRTRRDMTCRFVSQSPEINGSFGNARVYPSRRVGKWTFKDFE